MSKRDKIILILITVFYFIILCLSPISGDDWGNFIAKTDVFGSIKNAFNLYFTWEGRISSRLLINLLTPNKIVWNLINSLSIGSLIYISIKIVKPKAKCIYYLTLLMIPLINLLTFSETITFIAGNLTYFIEIPFILIYFSFIYNSKYNNSFIFILLIFLSLFLCMMVEHVSASLIIGNIILFLFFYHKNKSIDKKLIVLIIVCIISTLFMYFSPGSMYRMSIENIEFNKLNLFQKINYNLPSFIYYTFIVNYYLLFLSIISNYFMIKNNIKNTILKNILILFSIAVPMFTVIIYFISIIHKQIIVSNILLTLYYIIFTFISFILNIKEKNYKSIFFFLVGISANCVMLLSPTWGYRTSLFTYIMLCISNLIIISKYIKDNKTIECFSKIVLLIIALFYIILFVNVYKCQIDNRKYINQQLYEGKQSIEIYKFPYFINCNINPNTDYHKLVYKRYYNIPEEDELVLIDKWRYLIIYKN